MITEAFHVYLASKPAHRHLTCVGMFVCMRERVCVLTEYQKSHLFYSLSSILVSHILLTDKGPSLHLLLLKQILAAFIHTKA